MNHTLKCVLPLATLASAACVQPEAAAPEPMANLSTERACFFSREIDGYSEVSDDPRDNRIYVNTGVNERFLLETYGPCPDLNWSYRIGLDTRFSSSLCTGETVTLLVPRSTDGIPDRCTARILGKAER